MGRLAVGSTPRLIIFDCDGTLVDSQHMIVSAMTTALAQNGISPLPRGRVLDGVGLSLPEAMRRLLPEADDRLVKGMAQSYRDAFLELRSQPGHQEPLYDGAREALQRLANRDDLLLGIATGKARRGVNALVEREGFHGYFATIQTADTAPSKPHPAMIEQALIEVGVERSAAVMVGDTTFDIEMARNAGVAGVGVGWGYHPGEALREAGAHALVDDFDELLDEIERLFGLAARVGQ